MPDWGAWGRREATRNQRDLRVTVIRCTSCNRLRAHPKDWKTMHCCCGGIGFVASFPHPDEEQLAVRLYAQEIEQSNVYGRVAQELIEDWCRGK